MRANGESIYGTGPHANATNEHGVAVMAVTQRPGKLYLHDIIQPGYRGLVVIDRPVTKAHLLAHPSTSVPFYTGTHGETYLDLSSLPPGQRDPADTVVVVEYSS